MTDKWHSLFLPTLNVGNIVREAHLANMIVLVVQSFFLIHGRFLRPSMVEFFIQIATIRVECSLYIFLGIIGRHLFS